MKSKLFKTIVVSAILTGTSLLANQALYKSCVGCHGASGEKKALGKSEIISNMSEEDLNTALNGYKNGTYGKAMKGLMKGQVSKLSKDDIALLSKYITTLKK